MNKFSSFNLRHLVMALRQQQVIAYPTEAVFGLGCDPDSESAIRKLLALKKRPWQKGLILVAAHYLQLKKYIDDNSLNYDIRKRIFAKWPGPVTWVIPANLSTSCLLTGQYSSVSVRVCAFEPIRRLCLEFGKPLVSTSANIMGQLPARTVEEVRKKLGVSIPVMSGTVEGRMYPSEIRDALSNNLIRQG